MCNLGGSKTVAVAVAADVEPADSQAGSVAQRWVFGEKKSSLELKMKWPQRFSSSSLARGEAAV